MMHTILSQVPSTPLPKPHRSFHDAVSNTCSKPYYNPDLFLEAKPVTMLPQPETLTGWRWLCHALSSHVLQGIGLGMWLRFWCLAGGVRICVQNGETAQAGGAFPWFPPAATEDFAMHGRMSRPRLRVLSCSSDDD